MSEAVANPNEGDQNERARAASDPRPFSHPYFKELTHDLERATSRAERIEIVQRARRSAQEQFPKRLANLEKLLLGYSPFTVLAMFAFYDLVYLPEEGKRFNESGSIEQYHIELIQ